MLLSSMAGLVRQFVFAHFMGQKTVAADAFTAAFRIPNFLQNLFGEGVLSASFIPTYAKLLAEGDEEESGRLAGAIAALLALTAGIIVLVGVTATPLFIDVIAWGFKGERRELAISVVRVLFPGAGLLVMSAWCLGILNSHRKFFISYTAPLIWNAAMIATLVWYGPHRSQAELAVKLAWGSVIGSALQFLIQLPHVLRLVRRLRIRLDMQSSHVRETVRNFFPVLLSRGVVQISAFIDAMLASPLPIGAVAGLTNAQTLYTLPVRLFGGSVSAAELPAMSSALGNPDEIAAELRTRLDSGFRRIAFLIVPSAMALFALGDVVTGTVLQSGKFSHQDAIYVWGMLAGSAVGMLAQTLGRLYAAGFYALRDTRTPLRFALIRMVLTASLGAVCALWVPGWIGIDRGWGVAGLTASAGVAGWVEFVLLRSALNQRIGRTGLAAGFVARLWISAALAAAAGWAVKLAIGRHNPQLTGIAVLAPYGLLYFGATYLFGIEECSSAVAKVMKRWK